MNALRSSAPGKAKFVAFVVVLFIFGGNEIVSASLKVSGNKRFLVREDGTTFFYLADTAWSLVPRLTRLEVTHYLRDRADKRFTVIQTVAVVSNEFGGLNAVNKYGQQAFIDHDPRRPNELYFRHLDYVIEQAEGLRLYVALLPVWGGLVTRDYQNGIINGAFNQANSETFGQFIGARYGHRRNIIWVLGGDRASGTEEAKAVWRAMAKGIARGVTGTENYGRLLMTYHPVGPGHSSDWFHADEWLDFNMFQTGHFRYDIPNYEFAGRDYALTPAKPTLDGESRYEDHPVGGKPEDGRFDAFDMRQAAYWSVLGGACGHTYGNNNVWQMWNPNLKPLAAARMPWKQALDQPGAGQMRHVRNLFESRRFNDLVPDQSIIVGETRQGANHVRAARATDGSYLLVYVPTGDPITVAMDKVSGTHSIGWWYDPRTGSAKYISKYANNAARQFDPPGSGRDNDWVLVLDDAGRNFSKPGN